MKPVVNIEAEEAVREYLIYARSALEPSKEETAWTMRFNFKRETEKYISYKNVHGVMVSARIYDDQEAIPVFAAARAGDKNAHEVLIEIAESMHGAGVTLPRRLAKYVTRPRPKQNRGRQSEGYRDPYVLAAIFIAQKYGLHATRSDATDLVESACCLVARVMSELDAVMTYEAAKKIWKRRYDIDLPDF